MPKALEEALDNLVESTDEDLRREVAYALGGLGGDASVSPLCYLALKDSQARVRTEAVSALGKIGGPEAINALMQIAVKDRDEAVRTESVDALGGLWATTTSLHEGQRVRDCLQQVAQSDISPYVRERAVNMMSA
jgi:HEAT repeat protein